MVLFHLSPILGNGRELEATKMRSCSFRFILRYRILFPDDIRDETVRLHAGPDWRGEGVRGHHGQPAGRHVGRVVDQ